MNAILLLGTVAIIMSLCVMALAISGLRQSRRADRLIASYKTLIDALKTELEAKNNLIDTSRKK